MRGYCQPCFENRGAFDAGIVFRGKWELELFEGVERCECIIFMYVHLRLFIFRVVRSGFNLRPDDKGTESGFGAT